MTAKAERVVIYDTTLRDGAQGEGVDFSSVAKLRVARMLDEFGVDYIEGGFAASNPKDMAFFKEIRKTPMKQARIAAFGSTRRAGRTAAEDAGTQALLDAGTDTTTIFGKSWLLHVHDVLHTTDAENLAMIADTVRLLKSQAREVIYDAEHFFDGYKDHADYALATLKAAREAGADALVLCDTNGGCLPAEIRAITETVIRAFGGMVGVHTHNDGGLATANALEGVLAGARHVQGTMNGFGERTGNADLCTIMANLSLKMGFDCLLPDSLKRLVEVSEFVYEMANLRPWNKAPFVGASAFAHKAGMHVDGIRKNPLSFEHIPPESVGNRRRILMSELAGSSNVLLKAIEMGFKLDRGSPEVRQILSELERMEKDGYTFETADASFRLLIQKVLKSHQPFFDLQAYRVMVEKRNPGEPCISEATVKVRVGDQFTHTVGEGDGPVDALNNALRKALEPFFPRIAKVILTDYNVRILDPSQATAAKTRVLIESSDGSRNWGTIGVSDNIIEASSEALVDSMEYTLFMDEAEADAAATS